MTHAPRIKQEVLMSAMRPRAALVALLALAACSDDSVSAGQFVDDYIEAYCSYIMDCCDAAERSYMTKIACENGRRPYVEELLASKASGAKVTVLSDKAHSCIDALKSSDCAKATAARDCLAKVTQGQQAADEPCTYSPECESHYCIQPQKNVLGYCAASSDGNCSGDDRACETSAYCDSGTLQCTPRKDMAAQCDRPEECQSGICSAHLCVDAPSPLCDGQ